MPSFAVEGVEALAAGLCDVEVERLRLIDPLLTTCRGLDQPGRFDLEGGGVERLEIVGNAVDGTELMLDFTKRVW